MMSINVITDDSSRHATAVTSSYDITRMNHTLHTHAYSVMLPE